MSVGDVLKSMFDQGDLPAQVHDRRNGLRLTWSRKLQAYVTPSGNYVMWAGTVRRGWGVFFFEAKEAIRAA